MKSLESLTEDIINGNLINVDEAEGLWPEDFHDLLYCANKIRKKFLGDKVNLCSVINAKSGKCSENCRFCAQSGNNDTNVSVYPLVEEAKMEEALQKAKSSGASCFGIVTSGRRLTKNDVDNLVSIVPELSDKGIRISGSLGEIDEESLVRLRKSGVTRFHHNLETAESFFPNICTTHSYSDRVATLKKAKRAGLEVCSGGILGMGETPHQRIEFAFALRSLEIDSIPLNFLNPIPGTPLENTARLSCVEILKVIAIFRFILPNRDISVCGGREVNLRDMQSWIFYAGANGMMVGGYLTTGGRPVEQDIKMIDDLGLSVAGKS